ncbi:response regulator [Leclercia adecarboxylata]|uniref:Chemotaxis-specific methylesterase n=1 Tax=Leclercia adecarboxylata TaxID=83655 RepID=A0A4U9HMW8_9ENTR|nr:response regulator [Leclercia adecarboxylata]MCM7525629.1 response regulator [Enterobacter hormaechei]KFC90736.1 signal transduction response regulator receiver [Leclercia adecarboxylata ATCC 23216 = NBRC 102595]PHH03385.1 response regulator [Leclercia adecarboxylata]UBH65555.1 response regulator [Leclercia adecarboxylata]SPX64665.1 chemotaxis-specific methylesterase [Leclercia adecarboxylata]
MDINILVVEDNEFKRKRIVEIINSEFQDVKVTECHSFTSAWQMITRFNYELILLDMSLPTFDKTSTNSGGDFRVFGGKELARKMSKRRNGIKFIFITQFKSFSDNVNSYSYEALKDELLCQYKESCMGFILYSNTKSEWRDELVNSIKGLGK